MEKEQDLGRKIEPVDHNWFKNLSEKEKDDLYNSQQEEIYRNPKPIDGRVFSEEGFIELIVQQRQSYLWNTSVTQIKLATYRQRSVLQKIKGVVVLFHGLTSHTNEGSYVAKILADAGYEIVGFDQRGFGKSQGRRGYIENIQTGVRDSELFIENIRNLYKGVPIYLLGLSMGGLLSFNLGLKHPQLFEGLILMAPALRSFHGKSSLLTVKFLSFIYPYMQLPKAKAGKARHGSKNPNVSESRKGDNYRYRDDPYANTLKCVLDGMQESQEHFSDLKCKRLLLIQGAKDNSVNPDGIIELYQKSPCKNKSLLFYPNMWHNIWQQEEIYDIMPRILKWLQGQPE